MIKYVPIYPKVFCWKCLIYYKNTLISFIKSLIIPEGLSQAGWPPLQGIITNGPGLALSPWLWKEGAMVPHFKFLPTQGWRREGSPRQLLCPASVPAPGANKDLRTPFEAPRGRLPVSPRAFFSPSPLPSPAPGSVQALQGPGVLPFLGLSVTFASAAHARTTGRSLRPAGCPG